LDIFTLKLTPDLVGTIDLHVGLPDPLYLRQQFIITQDASTAQSRITLLREISPIP
ncbi:hypothetical protein C8R14_11080, partial [Nitrosomonas eutropha]